MARPTRAQIVQWLVEHGLTQVDPDQWLAGTFPEILRATVDAGRLAPRPVISFRQSNTFTSLLNVDEAFDITGANPGTIRVVKNMTIRIDTPNINTIIMQWEDGGVVTTRVWEDDGTPLFGTGIYIGDSGAATGTWGAMGLPNIVCYPPEMTQNIQRQIQIRLLSAAGEIKTVTVEETIVEFSAADWLPGVC